MRDTFTKKVSPVSALVAASVLGGDGVGGGESADHTCIVVARLVVSYVKLRGFLALSMVSLFRGFRRHLIRLRHKCVVGSGVPIF